MSTALVFGGSGFLGSHVADKLSERGFSVKIFDVVPSPYASADQEMIVGDILDLDAVFAAVEGADYVYNFAGMADIDAAVVDPLKTVQLNVLGTTHTLEACRHHGVARFVFASSIYVYSDLGSFYRSSKQACEKIIQNYQEEFDLDFTILRYGSLYGPRANEFNMIRRYIYQSIREGRIVRNGNGEELREYIHVEDAAVGSVEVLNEDYRNSFIVITGNQLVRVRDLLLMIREMMHESIEIEFIDPDLSHHYQITPYSFRPETAKRLMLSSYHDLGQGLLDMLYEAYESEQREKTRTCY